MKIVLGNFTGTVGKTTIASHIIAPRLSGADLISVETVNETALNSDETLRGGQFREIFRKLMLEDELIVDVGASNVEAFLDGVRNFDGAHLEVDRWVVPTTPGSKEQKETCSFVSSLLGLGVDPGKIRIVMNRVEHDAAEEFSALFAFAKKAKVALDPRAVLFENELFDLLAEFKTTTTEVQQDETDYKAVLKDKTAPEDAKEDAADKLSLRSLVRGSSARFDAVFAAVVE